MLVIVVFCGRRGECHFFFFLLVIEHLVIVDQPLLLCPVIFHEDFDVYGSATLPEANYKASDYYDNDNGYDCYDKAGDTLG